MPVATPTFVEVHKRVIAGELPWIAAPALGVSRSGLPPGTFAALGVTGFVIDGTWTLWELLETHIPAGKHLTVVDGVAVLVDELAP